MNFRSSVPHASSHSRRRDFLRVFVLAGLCAGLVSATLPWISREVATDVTQVRLLHRAKGPFAPVPSERSAQVLAGMSAS